MNNADAYKRELTYIKKYWNTTVCKTPNDKGLLIGLPHRYVSPSRNEFEEKMYYWDSYFIILGLLASGKKKLARGMADNLLHLFERFRFIPANNRFYQLAKSNPPLLSSICLETYPVTRNKAWLRKAAKAVEGEYFEVWNNQYRTTANGLNRYWDPTHYHEQAEDESGWDKTTRFLDHCLDINPVDLNALLYKYETDLAHMHAELRDARRARAWQRHAQVRKRRMDRLMWDGKKGFFFDYSFTKKKRTNAWSLAGYFPMWAGNATRAQAARLVKNLRRFERKGGLTATDKHYLKDGNRQWDYPNGWAPLHWIVVQGLLRYGYRDDARRIARKWLATNHKVFKVTGTFWERYNVVAQKVPKSGRYPVQSGFGWSCAVFLKFVEFLDEA